MAPNWTEWGGLPQNKTDSDVWGVVLTGVCSRAATANLAAAGGIGTLLFGFLDFALDVREFWREGERTKTRKANVKWRRFVVVVLMGVYGLAFSIAKTICQVWMEWEVWVLAFGGALVLGRGLLGYAKAYIAEKAAKPYRPEEKQKRQAEKAAKKQKTQEEKTQKKLAKQAKKAIDEEEKKRVDFFVGFKVDRYLGQAQSRRDRRHNTESGH